MSSLKLTLEPNAILHRPAGEVLVIDENIKKLAADMAETMFKEKGVGLAAPQINQSIKMFVIAYKDTYKVFINPNIYKFSKETNIDEEGCLSIPGVYGPVERSNTCNIKYHDEHGRKHDIKASGFFSRVIQHEYDHLNGVLITDKFVK